MSMRWKKFIGTFVLLGVLAVYVLLVMRVAVAVLPEAGPLLQLLFYAVAGMAWVLPVGYLIKWMNAPGRNDAQNGEHV